MNLNEYEKQMFKDVSKLIHIQERSFGSADTEIFYSSG